MIVSVGEVLFFVLSQPLRQGCNKNISSKGCPSYKSVIFTRGISSCATAMENREKKWRDPGWGYLSEQHWKGSFMMIFALQGFRGAPLTVASLQQSFSMT